MKFRFLTLVVIICSTILWAQKERIVLRPQYRERALPYGQSELVPIYQPVVGISLSGGGARGIAQIGVLKALVEENIPIDVVVGTSMGSIVGGLFSIGYTPDELDSIMRITDWQDLLAGNYRSSRKDLFVEQKQTEDRSVIELRLKGLTPILPNSINDGQRLTNYLSLITLQAPIREQQDFNHLEKKFRAVCTDLVTGKPVVLKSGSLAKALRASSSVSFLLSPVEFDSLLLVDGGLAANIPVEITRAEGVDFVLAVNTTSELHDEAELAMPWNVADQVISIPMKILNERQLKQADFVITPELGRKTSTDFSNLDSVILAGYLNTKKQIPAIKNKLLLCQQRKMKNSPVILNNPVIISGPEDLKEKLQTVLKSDSCSVQIIEEFLHVVNKDDLYLNLEAVISRFDSFDAIALSGKRAKVIESLSFSGAGSIHNDSLRSIILKATGRPFSGRYTYDLIKSVLNQYRSLGYSLAQIDTIQYNDTDNSLYLHIDEGRIDKIKITGNKFTSGTVIRRDIPIQENSLFVSSNLSQALTNLRSSNLFENIVVTYEPHPLANTLKFEVDERISSVARLGFKIENENWPQVNIDVRDENVFGSGTEVGIMSYLSKMSNSFAFEHKANRIFDTYFTYSLIGYYRFNDILKYEYMTNTRTRYTKQASGEYRQSFGGVSLSLGTQVARFGNVIFKGAIESNKLENLTKSPVTNSNVRLVTLRAQTTVDTQDKYPYATRGIKFTGFYEIASVKFGSEIGYTNIGGEYLINIPVARSHTLSTGLKLGFADKTLPLTKQYSLGGQYSFLGMKENEFRGRQLFVGSLEYRYLLPFKMFFDTYVQAKYNTGSIWELQNELKLSDFIHGVGLTLSWSTPIGPADFSIGRTFSLVPDVSPSLFKLGPVYFYFSIGYLY
ncbi:MAG: FtsQ-type POTRA domain-containing protein [Ignavibacteriales bacterium]|nr:FtsQ-type POTRA domain-containing protein [Ignavibacteriales bacterium]